MRPLSALLAEENQQEREQVLRNKKQRKSHGFLHRSLGRYSSQHRHKYSRSSDNSKSTCTQSTATAWENPSCTTSGNSSHVGNPPPLSLCTLSIDLKLQILEFCSVSCIRNMMQVNHHYREVLAASEEAKNLWKEQCHRQWNWLQAAPSLELVDEFHCPITAVATSTATENSATSTNTTPLHDEQTPNLSLLLSVAADKSTANDESIFSPCRWNAVLRRFFATGEDSQLRTLYPSNGHSAVVEFTGPVGHGDRCIRANQPLPRPRLLQPNLRSTRFKAWWQGPDHAALWRPFVAPYVQRERPLPGPTGIQQRTALVPRTVVNLTPRLISYFEVSILHPTTSRSDNDDNDGDSTQDVERTTTPESVGIGIATEDFSLHRLMPGWDDRSFGYHGDDGGLYHGQGHAQRSWRTFGAGDTIGCGVDYHKRAIFYTRNGQLVGYAFDMTWNDLKETDYYPVVGVDSHCPVDCNFGCDRPFLFDLQAMMFQQRAIVLQTLVPQQQQEPKKKKKTLKRQGRKPCKRLLLGQSKQIHSSNQRQ